MKPIEINNSKIAKWLGVDGITIVPFIFYYGEPSVSTRIHEYWHCHQVQLDGWLKFYTSYLWQYLKFRLSRLGHYDAYMNISYEIEAYSIQAEFDNWYENFPDKSLFRDEDLINVYKNNFGK